MYTIVPSANGYFMLPGDAVKYLRLAGAAQLKVLLSVYKGMGTPVELAVIARETGLSEDDARDALLFWQEHKLIATPEGASGAVLSPGETPGKAKDTPNEKDSPEKKSPAAEKNPSAVQAPAIPEKPAQEEKKIPKIKPTTAQINQRCRENPEIRELFLQAQNILGRTIGYDTQAQLLMCCDYLGLPVCVVLMICEYARSIGKTGISYITRTAEIWAQEGIDTLESANQKINSLEESRRVWQEFAQHVGISTPSPSKAQSDMMEKWIGVYRYDLSVVLLAYEEMANHITKFSMAYMDKTLAAWHEKGLKNAAGVRAYLSEHQARLTAGRKPPEQEKTANPPRRGQKPSAPAAASYDIAAAEQKAARGAPVYERKKKK